MKNGQNIEALGTEEVYPYLDVKQMRKRDH